VSPLVVVPWVLVALLGAAVTALAVNVYRCRRGKRQAGRSRPWRLPRRPLAEFDPAFAPGPFGPTLAAEVWFVGTGDGAVPGGTTDLEAWVLAVLAKRATRLFEFGTCTGKTAYLWARNAPPEARVTTLTLPPDGVAAYAHAPGDDAASAACAAAESRFARFLYDGTDVAHKVEQLFGDSKAFDEAPYVGRCDLVFVDGSHAYSYVVSDTRKALRMVRPGGVVLWHDYAGPAWAPGVDRALNELAATLPLTHLAGTKLVAYRRPPAAG
jgi:predicted O-methyltransferase YrrM